MLGIETNPYARELAQIVVSIRNIQWKYHNGSSPRHHPVVAPSENIRLADAILDLTDPDNPREPEWPEAEFIVGNPPFLGGSKIRRGLGDQYANALFEVYKGRVPASADMCCYWFEKARKYTEKGKGK